MSALRRSNRVAMNATAAATPGLDVAFYGDVIWRTVVRILRPPYGRTEVIQMQKPGMPWEDWFLITRSAVMESNNKQGQGLYAMRRFKPMDIIGRYEGTCMTTWSHETMNDAAVLARRFKKTHNLQCDYHLLRRRFKGSHRIDLIDGSRGGDDGAHLHKMNDGYPEDDDHPDNTVQFTDEGWAEVRHEMVVFDSKKSVARNRAAELTVSYGSDFWSNNSDGTTNYSTRVRGRRKRRRIQPKTRWSYLLDKSVTVIFKDKLYKAKVIEVTPGDIKVRYSNGSVEVIQNRDVTKRIAG